MSSLAGVDRQLNVVFSLALRETRTRFGGSQLGFLWAFAEPLLWILSLYAVFAIAERESPRGMGLFPFLATGLITYEIFAKTNASVAESISANRALLYYPQVRPLDTTYARGFLETATFISVFVVVMIGHASISGESLRLSDPLAVLVGLLLTGALGYALGLVFCMAQVVNETVKRLRGPLMRPMFWISGLFFTASSLPLQVRETMLFNPLFHCIEIVRGGWFESYDARYADAPYVVAWVISLLFVGMTLERMVRSRVEV